MWDRLRTATSTATSATATPASAATTNTAFASADDFLHHPLVITPPRRRSLAVAPPSASISRGSRASAVPGRAVLTASTIRSTHWASRATAPTSSRFAGARSCPGYLLSTCECNRAPLSFLSSPPHTCPPICDARHPLAAVDPAHASPTALVPWMPVTRNIATVLPSQQQDLLAAPGREPPPRDPRRRLQQHHQLHQSDSHWRPTSSVYDDSDDTIKDADHTGPVKQASGDMYSRPAAEEQVSPPSSPEPGAFHGGHAAGDVSPIDEELDRFQQQLLGGPLQQHPGRPASQQQRSQIPSLQHAHHLPRSTLGPSAPQLRQPTPESRAWERQVHPGQRPAPQQNTMARERAVEPPNPPQAYGSTTVITAPASSHRNTPSPSFGQRMRFIGRSKPEPLDSRPPWHGASGRTKLIKPVRDDLKAGPLQIPRKSSKRTGRGGVPISTGAHTPGGQTTSETPNAGATTAQARTLRPLPSDQEAARKAMGPSWHTQSPPQFDAGAHSYPSPPDTDYLSPSPPAAAFQSWNPSVAPTRCLARRATVEAYQAEAPPGASTSSTGATLSHSIGPSAGPSNDQDAWVQPPSRFSVTTYATSNPGSPRQSVDEPPVPALPALATSVMDRRRPVAGEHNDRATPEPIVISMSSPYSASSHEPVHERTAHARIASESQQSDRRSIKQMTELMPADNLLASEEVLRKREVEKQKVDTLRGELAEVQREEYELGLKLHRAYKRLDQDAEYEPTTLWVRRVTG
ncbi:hypothetical protein ACCO45_003663 [Purpureocillium lilacinum]|uniref:Uncharacterized protein n=1 Tax=Purpureocillium lilacinum TaxID=33203 RepID=A0ACC4E0I8_PURLI